MAKSRRADEAGNGASCRLLPELVERDPGNHAILDLASHYCRAKAVQAMATALHDLRSPCCSTRLNLANLRVMIERLMDPHLTREQIVETARAMSAYLDAMDHVSKLEEEILDTVTPLPEGAHPEPQAANLRDVIGSTRTVMCAQCFPNDLVVVRDIPDVRVAASVGDLLRVLINLVRNAVTATAGQRHPRVEVSAWVTDSAAFVRVEDNGRGMGTAAKRPVPRRLVVSKSVGSGLGLASVRLCVERWAGQMKVRSTRDEGTEIVFSIPLSTPAGDAIGQLD